MTIKKEISKLINKCGYKISRITPKEDFDYLFKKYKDFTMVPEYLYNINLKLVNHYLKNVEGDVIECGVWKGGMSAGIAEMLGNERKYFLFDSFEGLPEVKEIDGIAAKEWQKNITGEEYYDNCNAPIEYADKAMKESKTDFKLIKGWFKDTLPKHNFENKIALLRLDGDWYDSTMECLKYIYPYIAENGLILIDDYYTWDGCSKAVHDYLSEIKSISRIRNTGAVCYIIKKDIEK